MTAASPKRRARRIAADEAHAWARNLRLRNPYAKLVLCMITQYVQGDGTCFVGLKALAEDCELSDQTIRSRLSWLETVGAIVRLPQWVDEYGRRNSEERGRRTTDEIRLLFDADLDDIEARALGGAPDDSEREPARPRAVTLSHGIGSAAAAPSQDQALDEATSDDEKTASPPVSPSVTLQLRRGPDSSEPEPEPERDPPTPQRGAGDDEIENGIQEGSSGWPHVETWKRFEQAWQEPILHQRMCRQIWSAFTDIERETAIRVGRGYVKWRTSQRRPPNPCNAQKILREREAWPTYEKFAGPDPALRVFIAEDSPEFTALRIVGIITGILPPLTHFDQERGARGHWWKRGPLPADLLGLTAFADKKVDDFSPLEIDSTSTKAWAARIHQWIGIWPKTLRVPCPWPPRKDGTLADQSAATNDDNTQLGKTG